MQNESLFDLNCAIQHWRENLAQSSAFGRENLNELESHLRSSVDAIEARGFSREEAFMVAVKRLGNCSCLEKEFSKVNSHAVWIDRILWMLIGVQAWAIITDASAALVRGGLPFVMKSLFQNFPRQMIRVETMALIYSLVQLGGLAAGIALCWWLIRKNLNQIGGWLDTLLRRQLRWIGACAGLCLLLFLLYALCSLSGFFAARFLRPSDIAQHSMFLAYARVFVMEPVQILILLTVTLFLVRKRFQLRHAFTKH